ncbi:MAG: phosphotransferase [Paludibacteraceae bacterium]
MQSGSNRQYSREVRENGGSYIRVVGTNRAENHAFITLARHFRSKGLPVPEVYEVSEDEMVYTQEDLGDTLLFDYIRHGRETGCFSEEEKSVLRRVIRLLPHIQIEGAEGLDWSVCYPVPAFDRQSVFWDLNYFKYCYLKGTQQEFSEPALEADFNRLADALEAFPYTGFMYRDFQSRNVMLRDGEPYLIDFQGGRRGPLLYDVVSFLWQAKANFPSALRRELIAEYEDELRRMSGAGGAIALPFTEEQVGVFVLFRTLQVLGAYGFRGYFERKPHFLQSIPFALRNAAELLREQPRLAREYPEISRVLSAEGQHLLDRRRDACVPSSTCNPNGVCNTDGAVEGQHLHEVPSQGGVPLTVTIYSFSFKKGIPEDKSGNGGGYVFDCRATHNPGKYEQYKHLTGRDQPVIDFLEQDGEILTFLESVYLLLDHHVERYLERGFSHLQAAFGCTGGQHRSVYSADAAARHLRERFPNIRIELIHREQPHL